MHKVKSLFPTCLFQDIHMCFSTAETYCQTVLEASNLKSVFRASHRLFAGWAPGGSSKGENIVSSSLGSCENSLTCGHPIPIRLHLHSVFLSVDVFSVYQISLFPHTIKIFVNTISSHSYNPRQFSILKLLNVAVLQSIYM